MSDDFMEQTFTAPQERLIPISDAVCRFADPERPMSILDLGCGTGEQLRALAAVLPMAALMGIDISEANIRTARGSLAGRKFAERIQFRASDYMAFGGGPFDLVLSDSTLQNIAAPTQSLFAKIAADLICGGFLIATMPDGCFYNRMLWRMRRLFLLMRCPATDAAILWLAVLLHGRAYPRHLLRQRVAYMYRLPRRWADRAFYDHLARRCSLRLVSDTALRHASLAQPKHRLLVFRKDAP